MASDNELIIKINGSAKNFIDELDKVKKKTEDLQNTMGMVAKSSAVAFAGFAAAIALSTKAFADYETALVGVGKTTDITGNALKNFGKEFQKLSTTIPVSTNELLGIAQAAGQLGIKGEENLLKFTDTVAKLGVATDLTGQDAATALARILNVTGESISSIDKLGSVIVAMGNNFAASESEIVRVTTEVARSTAIFNVSSASAVALSTAMRSVGIQAELGGSAVGRTFRAIDKAVRAGGASLENLAAVTGMTGEQLRVTFKENSVEVFQAFIEGLGRIDKAGGSSTQALAAFGLKGDEILKVLPTLAKNSTILGDALTLAAKETKNATALNKEAAAAFATLNSEAQLAKNNFENLKVSLGEKLAPTMSGIFSTVSSLLKGIANLNTETIGTIATFLKWGAIISGIVVGISGFLFGAIQVSSVIVAIGAAFLPATVAASAFWIALTGPIGIAVAGIAALTVGVVALTSAMNKKNETPETLDEINKKLNELKKTYENVLKAQEKYGKGDLKVQEKLAALDKEIDKLEELRQAKLRSSQDFGTGEMLVRPKATGALSDLIPSFGNATIPLKTETEAGDSKAVDVAKENQSQITEVVDAGTQARIAAARREQVALEAIAAEKTSGLLAEDVKLLEQKAAIEDQYAQARLIKNTTERELAIQNLDLKHAEELLKIEEFEAVKAEQILARKEEQDALRATFDEEEKVRLDAFNQAELQSFQASIDTKAEAQKKYDTERIQKNIAVQNQFKQDELKYGTEVAKMKQFFASEELQGVKNTSGDLAQLMNSRNSTMKGIGKAAARVNAAIATAEGAIKAYTSLAGIPIIGPALGGAAATALVAYGVEQQSKISAAATGGFVPQVSGGARDRVPMLLSPNELVVPEALAPNFIQAAGLPDTQSDRALGATGAGESTILTIELNDRAGEMITLNQRQGKALGLIGAN